MFLPLLRLSLTSATSAPAVSSTPTEQPAPESSDPGVVPVAGAASWPASLVPSSARRTLRSQTAASFVAAGGVASPVTTHKGKGKKKAKCDEVGPDNSDDLVKIGGTPFIPGEDDIFNRNRLVGNEVVIASSVVSLQRSNKAVLDTLGVLLTAVEDLKKASGSALSLPPLSSDPAFTSLYGAHVETRVAVNRLATVVDSFPPSLQLNAAVASLNRPEPFSAGVEGHIVSPAAVGPLPSSHAAFSLPPLPQLPVVPPVHSMRRATVPRHDLPPAAGVKRKRGDALVTDQDALYGPVSRDVKVWDVASAAVNTVPGLNAVMIYSARRAARGDFLSIRFHTKEYALKFVHLFQYTEGQGDKIAFFPEGSPNLPAQGVASSSRPMLR